MEIKKQKRLLYHPYKRRQIAVPLFFITLAVTGPAGCYPSLPDALSSLSPTRASSRRPRLSIGSDGITLSVHRDMKLFINCTTEYRGLSSHPMSNWWKCSRTSSRRGDPCGRPPMSARKKGTAHRPFPTNNNFTYSDSGTSCSERSTPRQSNI